MNQARVAALHPVAPFEIGEETLVIRTLRLMVLLSLASALAAPAATPPPAASETITVQVPAGMASPPFDVPRKLQVPTGFSIRVFARVEGARFMALAPDGDLLVSDPGAGTIMLLRPAKGGPRKFRFASGMHHPHDIVFHTLHGKTYVYVAESDRIVRAAYLPGHTRIGPIEIVVDHLPDASSERLRGSYGHQLKNIAINGDKLYVSIGSSCNVCASDTRTDPVRASIYEYDADGGHRRLYAQGLRNAEGLAFEPGTDRLWAVVNERDNMAYPFHKDWDGDGSDDYGKVIQSYVDGHPAEMLTQVKDGGNYGWPFCNDDPDQGLSRMPYQRDVQTNPAGSKLDCGKIDRAMRGIPAHSAPLGLSFLQDSGLPPPYRNALVTALHGCWNCSKLNGHKIALYPLQADDTPGGGIDLVSGWISDAAGKQRWGRPVDVIPAGKGPDGKGGLYISDDYSGTVYLLSPSE